MSQIEKTQTKLLLGLILILAVFPLASGVEAVSNTQIPSVGLCATYINEYGHNQTFIVTSETSTDYIVNFEYDKTEKDYYFEVSKSLWSTYTFGWNIVQNYINTTTFQGSWSLWIHTSGLDIDKTIVIGHDDFTVTEQKILVTPLSSQQVFIANHSDGRSYWFESNTGLLLGYVSNIETSEKENWGGVWILQQTNAEINDFTTTIPTTIPTTTTTTTGPIDKDTPGFTILSLGLTSIIIASAIVIRRRYSE